MDTKSYVEYLLKNYHQIKREIEMLKPLLNQDIYESMEETIEGMVFKTSQEEKVQSTKVSDKTASIALTYRQENERENLKEKRDLEKVIKGNERELLQLEQVIETLSSQYNKVIKGIYIKRQSRKQLCSQLFISENTLNRYRKKGVEEMVRVFEGYLNCTPGDVMFCKNIK